MTWFVAVCALFVVSRLFLTFGYQPTVSDTKLYALYGMTAKDASQQDKNPYLHLKAVHGDYFKEAAGRDLTVEYPPLALFFMKGVANLTAASTFEDGAAAWQRAFRISSMVADGLIFGVMAWLWWSKRSAIKVGLHGLLFYVVGGVMMHYFLYDRLDLWLAGLTIFAVLAMASGAPWPVGFFLLAAAINFKLVPVMLLPLFVIGSLPCALLLTSRPIAWIPSGLFRSVFAVGACAAIFVPFVIIWGPDTLEFARYHGERGIQIESTLSSLLMPLQYLGYGMYVDNSFGSYNLVTEDADFWSKLSTLASLAAGLGIAGVYLAKSLVALDTTDRSDPKSLKGRTVAAAFPQLFIAANFLTLAAGMVTAKVLSPQYFVWLIPFSALLSANDKKDRAVLAACAAAFALTTPIYPYLYHYLVHSPRWIGVATLSHGIPEAPGIIAVLARNIALILFVVLLYRRWFETEVFAQTYRKLFPEMKVQKRARQS